MMQRSGIIQFSLCQQEEQRVEEKVQPPPPKGLKSRSKWTDYKETFTYWAAQNPEVLRAKKEKRKVLFVFYCFQFEMV